MYQECCEQGEPVFDTTLHVAVQGYLRHQLAKLQPKCPNHDDDRIRVALATTLARAKHGCAVENFRGGACVWICQAQMEYAK